MYQEPAQAYAETMQREDRAPGVVEDLHKLADSLSYQVDQIGSRLEPVLRPEYGEAAKMAASVPAPATSAARSAHDRIAHQIARLAALCSQVDV